MHRAHAAEIERTLGENILRFWHPRCLDREKGGYAVHYGPRGEAKPGNKGIVTQARMLWLFARVARSGCRPAEMLEAAEWGYRFLLDRMWDSRHGGFFWEVDAGRGEPVAPKKHVYGQAFGLYALSEYYLAGGPPEALQLAARLFELLETKAHDAAHGGYVEFFNRDWAPAPPGEPGYMGDPKLKLMNTHLHLLEAMTTLYRASRREAARERLLELITIESNAVVRKGLTACTDKYDRDWRPRLDGENARVSYGHDLENIWLLMEANDAAGLPDAPLADLYRELFAYSLRYGYDEAKGGFFDGGMPGSPADLRNKTWWVQAEALVCALRMHRLTSDPLYWRVFQKTWEFTRDHVVDWTTGEWHATVAPDGTAGGDKGGPWKAGYHNGRAMIECLGMLRGMADLSGLPRESRPR